MRPIRRYNNGGVNGEKGTASETPREIKLWDVLGYMTDTRSPEGEKFDFYDVMNRIGFHESSGTMDPKQKQLGGGPGRGIYQIEPETLTTMQNRLKLTAEALGFSNPSWNTSDLELDDLTREQQDLLMVANMLQGPHKNAALASGDMSLEDYWANYHWAGSPKDRQKRINSFRESMKRYDSQQLNPLDFIFGTFQTR